MMQIKVVEDGKLWQRWRTFANIGGTERHRLILPVTRTRIRSDQLPCLGRILTREDLPIVCGT
jgi:hypothetical protein